MPLDFSYQIDVYSKPTPPPPPLPPANRRVPVVQPTPGRRGGRQPVVIPDPRRQGGGDGRRPVLPLPQDQPSTTPFDGGGDSGGLPVDLWNGTFSPARHLLSENKRDFVGNFVGDLKRVISISMGVYGGQIRNGEPSVDGGGGRAGPDQPNVAKLPVKGATPNIVINQSTPDKIRGDIKLWAGTLGNMDEDNKLSDWVDDLKRLYDKHEWTSRISTHVGSMVTRAQIINQLFLAFYATVEHKIGGVTGTPDEQKEVSDAVRFCSNLSDRNDFLAKLRQFDLKEWHDIYVKCYVAMNNVSKTIEFLTSKVAAIEKYTRMTGVDANLQKIKGYSRELASCLGNEIAATSGMRLDPLTALPGHDEFNQFHARISTLLHDIMARWDNGPAADEGPEEPPPPPDDDSGGGGRDGRGGDGRVPGGGGGVPEGGDWLPHDKRFGPADGDDGGRARREPPPPADRVVPGGGGGGPAQRGPPAGRDAPDGDGGRPARVRPPPAETVVPDADGGRAARREPPPAGEDGRGEGRGEERRDPPWARGRGGREEDGYGQEEGPFPGRGDRRREFGEGGGDGWQWEDEGPAAGGGGRERPAADESGPEDLGRLIARWRRGETVLLGRIEYFRREIRDGHVERSDVESMISVAEDQLKQVRADILNAMDRMKSDGEDDKGIALAIEDSRLEMEIRESEEDVARLMARIMEMRGDTTEENRKVMERSIKEVQDSLDSVQGRIHDLKMEHSQVHAAMIADIATQIDDLPDFLKKFLEDPEAAGTSDRQVAANVRKIVREDPGLDAGAMLEIIRVMTEGIRGGGSQAHRRLRAMKERLEAMRSSPGLYKAWLNASLADRQQAT